MTRFNMPGTVVVTCPFPAQVSPVEATRWLRSVGAGPAVTWIATSETLPLLRDASAAGADTHSLHGAALEIDPAWLASKTTLRQELRCARQTWPGLTAAVLRGPIQLEHRDVFVQEGITTICTDTIADQARGQRRPAPRGWPCRSVLWGLWEVTSSAAQSRGVFARIRAWRAGPAGGLTLLHAAGGPNERAAAVRSRLEKQVAWARRQIHAGRLEPATLADLPAIIAGGGAAGPRGSVLRAA